MSLSESIKIGIAPWYAIGLADAEKVIDNETGEEITLFEAHKKYGRDGVHDNTNFSLKIKYYF